MKKKLWVLTAVLAICLLAALPAMAGNVFTFTEKTITLFEGEAAETALNRDGNYTEGEVVYTTESAKVATVSADGTITAVYRGPDAEREAGIPHDHHGTGHPPGHKSDAEPEGSGCTGTG